MYCNNCGKEIKDESIFCNSCGKRLKEENIEKGIGNNVSGKNKTSAIILSVLLGFFGWLYMYKKNAGKFWVVLVVAIFLMISYGLTYDYVISAIFLPVIWVFNIGVYVWVILDYALKPEIYYTNYPN